MKLRLAFLRLFRPKLQVWDFKLSRIGAIGLKYSSQATRIGIYEATEIIRLTYVDKDMRKAAKDVQKILMDFTKSNDNLLPHENVGKKEAKETKESKLLPRFDIV